MATNDVSANIAADSIESLSNVQIKAPDGSLVSISLSSDGHATTAEGTSTSGAVYKASVPVTVGMGPILIESSGFPTTTFSQSTDGPSISFSRQGSNLTFFVTPKWAVGAPGGGAAPVIMKTVYNGEVLSNVEAELPAAMALITSNIQQRLVGLSEAVSYLEPFLKGYLGQETAIRNKISLKLHWSSIAGGAVAAFNCTVAGGILSIPTAGAAIPIALVLCAGSAVVAAILADATTDSGSSGPDDGGVPIPGGSTTSGDGDTKPVVKD